MSKITLRNDFHGTQVTLTMKSSFATAYQIKKAQKTLCGIAGCTCGNVMGMRGPQDVEVVGQEYSVDFGLIPRFSVPN